MTDSTPTALVTGANRGIGKEVCRQLLQQGWRVIAGARDQQAGATSCAELRAATGADDRQLVLRRIDVTAAEDARSLARWLSDSGLQLQALINNAGVFLESAAGGNADPLAVAITTVLQTINVNTLGPLRMIQALAPVMLNGARIVNVSSAMGQLSDMGDNYLGYRMSKTALNALTVTMARRLQSQGVLVNACCPGWVRTDMGGAGAERSVAQGADTIVWLVTAPEANSSGGFYRDRAKIAW